MGQFPDVKWPEEYNELTKIEDLLHCRICYEYIETCVITPCSHNYCSICIRKFLHYKTQCPICFENTYEKDLHANRVLDEFMEYFITLREKLFACIKGVEVKDGNVSDTSLKNVTPIERTTPLKKMNSLIETPKKLSTNRLATGWKSPDDLNGTPISKTKTPLKYFSSPSTSDKIPKKNNILADKNEERPKTDINYKRVPCPVCCIEISETNINKHLDDCLKRQRSMSPVSNKGSNNGLEPMPKYVFNLMKDSEIRKILKKYGLSTSGVRKTLEKRLQKFSILYNVERDKLVPKSIEDLAKICEVEENIEKNILKMNSGDCTLNIDRKTDATLIEKAHKQYLEKNRDDYQKLIESINERDKRNNKSRRSLLGITREEDNVATTSSLSQSSIFNQSDDNNESRSSVGDASFYNIHDTSNSTNASYPLQHYSNDDPLRYLALGISSDTEQSDIKSKSNNSSTRNVTSVDSKMKFDQWEESDKLIPSNLTSLNSSFIKKEVIIDDIYDLSTEDNCSDECGKEFSVNKSRKHFTKRAKVVDTQDINERSTSDSDTDVETNDRLIVRKSAVRNENSRDNGKNNREQRIVEEESNDDDENNDKAGSSSVYCVEKKFKENKENLKSDSRNTTSTTTTARRSTRKRTHVGDYAASSHGVRAKIKKVKEQDLRVANPQDEPLSENLLTNVLHENDDDDKATEFSNVRKRSSRKRGKT